MSATRSAIVQSDAGEVGALKFGPGDDGSSIGIVSPVVDGTGSQSGGGGTTAGNAGEVSAAGGSRLRVIGGKGSNVDVISGGGTAGGGKGGELGGVNFLEVVAELSCLLRDTSRGLFAGAALCGTWQFADRFSL